MATQYRLHSNKTFMEARPGSASSPRISLEIFLAAVIALGVAAILLRNDPGGLSGDPDSYMHLARFRDGYGIFHGGFVRRDNAPYGTVLPWTMPMDGALGLFYAIGRLFAGPGDALYFAARVVSPFFCASIGPLMFLGLRPFFDLRARVVMGGMAALSPGLLSYSLPGDADHHAMVAWSGVLFAVALIRYLFLARPRSRHGAVAGLAAALALWASLEGFIVIGVGLSALVLYRCLVEEPETRSKCMESPPHPASAKLSFASLSLRNPLPRVGGEGRVRGNLLHLIGLRSKDRRTWMNDLVFCGAFALALTAAWLIDPPYEGLWALKVDRLSFVYVSFVWLFAATLVGLDVYLSRRAVFSPPAARSLRRTGRPRNLMVAALLGGAALLCWVAIAPDVLKGPFGQVDPALFGLWIDHVSEMLPMWHLDDFAASSAVAFILVWVSLAVLIARASGPQRWLWIGVAVLMVPISLIGIRYIRASYYAEVFGAIPLGLVLANRTRQYPKYIGYAAIPAMAVVMLGMSNATVLLWHQLSSARENRQTAVASLCSLESLTSAIAPIQNSDAIVMTELDVAPTILYLSPRLRTVAGPFHRNTAGILDQFAFFGAHDERAARAILDKRGVKYVLICDTGEKQRSDSFGGRILRAPPAWLQPLGPSDPQPGFRLYRVRSGNG